MNTPNRKSPATSVINRAVIPPDFPRDHEADAARNRRVEQALVRRACGYRVALKKTHKLKRVEYDPDTGKKVAEVETLVPGTDEVHVPGDLRATTYWLNNRDPLHWREEPAAVSMDPSDELSDLGNGHGGGVVEIAAVAPAEPPPAENDL